MKRPATALPATGKVLQRAGERLEVNMNQKPDIDYLARLARMELSGEEKKALTGDLDSIISYMNVLSSIDTEGVEPMEHVLGLSNIMRPDELRPPFDRELLLGCAAKAEDGYYDVPLAVEEV